MGTTSSRVAEVSPQSPRGPSPGPGADQEAPDSLETEFSNCSRSSRSSAMPGAVWHSGLMLEEHSYMFVSHLKGKRLDLKQPLNLSNEILLNRWSDLVWWNNRLDFLLNAEYYTL